MELRLKRAYETPATSDGVRILVDRLWPRGLKKADAGIDVWAKDVAPSNELRRWFGHDPEKWDEFRRRYRAELNGRRDAVEALRGHFGKGATTLVYSARDEAHNQAVALKEYLERAG